MKSCKGFGTLVVGGCQAGIQIASTLRERGYSEPIAIVEMSEHLPYQRPPLSKALIKGDLTAESLSFRSPSFYHEKKIELYLGEHIEHIEKYGDGSGTAYSSRGAEFRFERLGLATGAEARRLALPGSGKDCIRYLRDLDDALFIKQDLERANKIVVIGSGFIGLEVAACSKAMGKDVTVVSCSDRLLSRVVGPITGRFLEDAHRSRGVRIIPNTVASDITLVPSGFGCEVKLSSGEVLMADLVVAGIGALPRVALAEEIGLKVDNGIVVDAFGVASDGYTFAAGDCANYPCPLQLPGYPSRVRFESVSTAVEQAKVVAGSILGAPMPYNAVPWFWSDQFDLKLQVAGIVSVYDNVIVRGNISLGKFCVIYTLQNYLVGAECVNSPGDFLALRAAVVNGALIRSEDLSESDKPIKSCLSSKCYS